MTTQATKSEQIHAPFTLVLNQVYAPGWTTTVNGVKLSPHAQNGDSFNTWYISQTGSMSIDIYYVPQTVYLASMIVSIVTIASVSLYIVVASARKMWRCKSRS